MEIGELILSAEYSATYTLNHINDTSKEHLNIMDP